MSSNYITIFFVSSIYFKLNFDLRDLNINENLKQKKKKRENIEEDIVFIYNLYIFVHNTYKYLLSHKN